MIYDFNIPYPNNNDTVERERIEKILNRLHSIDTKGIIALNLTLEGNLANVEPISPIAPEKYPNIQQLTRATLLIEDTKHNYQLSSSSAYPKIGILAVRPTNLDICKHACQTLEVDLISIDLAKSRALPNFAMAQVAVNRGIFFEICYSQSFRDPSRKSMFFNNVKRLIEVTRGHNLIFSSEAIRALDIRRTSDLRILASMYGMTQDQIEATISVNYPKLLKKAETRRLTYNATISFDKKQLFRESENAVLKRKNNEQQQSSKKSTKKAKRPQ
ncbi:RNase P subunit p30-domain-containing protein [Cokeromyces recurvatus]|uniref:RNase P subunit p30-domain-containing protein n=1 Tax=Cokeromyces recurvatus TaxID=90255 RepID=UPI002220E08C|nr:RNase P subunit p30-domain-containing protein [Cokeromyces recurvatus]KAI7904450.1 RNase P subunit p30-domain-containing protein [Cokeromyces recurvatus]